MAFWDKTDARIPDKLRELTPEQMEQMVDFYNANKDRVGQLETELGTTKQTLSNVETQFTETRNRVAQLEAAVTQQQQPQPTADTTGTGYQQAGWFEDPDRAFFEKVKPLADFSLAQGARNAKRDLEDHLRDNPGKFGDNFKLYKKFQREITDLMSREALSNQANPQAWLNAFSLIKGYHDDEIAEARKNADAEFFGEATARNSSPPETKTDVVTDSQREAAKKWGVSPEEVHAAGKTLTYEIEGQRPKGF
jgi:hypothetical protein